VQEKLKTYCDENYDSPLDYRPRATEY